MILLFCDLLFSITPHPDCFVSSIMTSFITLFPMYYRRLMKKNSEIRNITKDICKKEKHIFYRNILIDVQCSAVIFPVIILKFYQPFFALQHNYINIQLVILV